MSSSARADRARLRATPRSGPRRRFPSASKPGVGIGGNRPKLTFIGWKERGPASIASIWPPVMWLMSAPITVVVGGGRPEGLDKGHFVSPTLFADVTNDMTIAREEIFGPVLSLIAYDDLEDAIAIANDTDYGLAGAVFTADLEKGIGVARRVRTGTFAVNTTQGMDFNGPFGGFKSSGVGRELGPEGIHAFCEDKTISLPGGVDLPIGG